MPDPVFAHNQSQVVKARRDKLVQVIKANPGMTTTEIGKRHYEVEKLSHSQRRQLSNMLTQLCFDQRIKYIDFGKYE